ncbi:unnamed protein product [Tilletia controversa]|nr:unnamed protein product [Tilletia controversa]
MRGYDLDEAESSAKRKAPGPSTRSPSRRGASQGADQTDRVASSVHSSEEEDLPSAQGLRKRLRSTQSSSTAQPTPSTSTTAAQAKGKGRAKPGPPSSGPRSTLEERTLLGLAKQIPSAESRTRASTRGPSNRSTFAGMSSSTALSIPAQRSSTSRSMTLNISSDDSSDNADGDEDGTTARQKEGRSGGEGPAAAAQKGSAATESGREATAAPAALKEPSASAQEAKLAAPLIPRWQQDRRT